MTITPEVRERLLKLRSAVSEAWPYGLQYSPTARKWHWSRHVISEGKVEHLSEKSAASLACMAMLRWLATNGSDPTLDNYREDDGTVSWMVYAWTKSETITSTTPKQFYEKSTLLEALLAACEAVREDQT